MNKKKIRTYSELRNLETFEERFDYLAMPGQIGEDTFGFDRYLNQKFYKSKEWQRARDAVILRDGACDLGVRDRDIYSTIKVHHMNPIGPEDIKHGSKYLLDPEYLISTSTNTHNAIHFGNKNNLIETKINPRTPNDCCPWKK